MKKYLLTACFMAISFMASAQFAASNSGFGPTTKTSTDISGHSSFYVQYNSFGVGEFADILDDMDAESDKLTGFTLGGNKTISVDPSLPLFIEVGAGLTYAWAKIYDEEESGECYWCEDEYSMSEKESSQHLMINIPVNLMYKFKLPNSSITLEPYVGLNVKGHLLGQMKGKITYEACCDDIEDVMDEMMDEIDEDDLTANYFDKDDMGGKKYVAKRVNVGWQIGANIDFGSAFVGVSYGSDFNKFMKVNSDEWTFSATNVTVGLRF